MGVNSLASRYKVFGVFEVSVERNASVVLVRGGHAEPTITPLAGSPPPHICVRLRVRRCWCPCFKSNYGTCLQVALDHGNTQGVFTSIQKYSTVTPQLWVIISRTPNLKRLSEYFKPT